MNSIVKITPNALKVLKDIYVKSNHQYLSFGIKSGGCSGFQYLIKPCNQDLERGDELVKIDELKLKVNSSSILHLLGTEIDWTEDIMGNRFVFNNPNAEFKCGCGSSFG
mgnify:FL=1